MDKSPVDDPVAQQSILNTAGGDDPAVDLGASTGGDADRPENNRAGDRPRGSVRTLPKEVVVSAPDADEIVEYAFEVTGDVEELEPEEDGGRAVDEIIDFGDRVRVEGAVGSGDDRFAFSGDLIRVDVPPEVRLEISDRGDRQPEKGDDDWRDGYREYATKYVPAFYESVPTKKNLYRCIRYVGERSQFWQTLSEKMYLSKTVVTAAYVYPLPNYRKVDEKSWDGILGDVYADMPEQYGRKRKYPPYVPVFVVYLYDGCYNAVAYLRPYGDYVSYGYAIKNGYKQRRRYDSKSDYESNTWWWTEDGWGDAGDTDGGILDGVPARL
jgi:hypothetical protein